MNSRWTSNIKKSQLKGHCRNSRTKYENHFILKIFPIGCHTCEKRLKVVQERGEKIVGETDHTLETADCTLHWRLVHKPTVFHSEDSDRKQETRKNWVDGYNKFAISIQKEGGKRIDTEFQKNHASSSYSAPNTAEDRTNFRGRVWGNSWTVRHSNL